MGLPVLFAQILYQPAFFTRRSVAMARDLVISLSATSRTQSKQNFDFNHITRFFLGLFGVAT
jgi:hypothetical protein